MSYNESGKQAPFITSISPSSFGSTGVTSVTVDGFKFSPSIEVSVPAALGTVSNVVVSSPTSTTHRVVFDLNVAALPGSVTARDIKLSNGGNSDSNSTVSVNHGFSPTDISSLAVWLDGTDTSTISESASAISQWGDKSGNGRDFVQVTSADQPMLMGAFGSTLGQQHVLFQNNNSLNVGVNFPYSTASGIGEQWTAAAVFAFDTVPAGNNLDLLRLVKPQGASVVVRKNNLGNIELEWFKYSQGSFASNPTVAEHTKYLMVVTNDNTNVTLRLNGVSHTRTTPNSTYGTTSNGYVIGQVLNGLVAYIGEFCHFNQALSASEITQLESYLTSKWNV